MSAGIFTKPDVFADPARYLKGFGGTSEDVLLFEDSIHTITKALACGIGMVAGVPHGYNEGIGTYCDICIGEDAE